MKIKFARAAILTKQKSDLIVDNIERDGPDVHDPDKSFTYFKKQMYQNDKRIKVDPVLEKYLNDDKYESLKNFFSSV